MSKKTNKEVTKETKNTQTTAKAETNKEVTTMTNNNTVTNKTKAQLIEQLQKNTNQKEDKTMTKTQLMKLTKAQLLEKVITQRALATAQELAPEPEAHLAEMLAIEEHQEPTDQEIQEALIKLQAELEKDKQIKQKEREAKAKDKQQQQQQQQIGYNPTHKIQEELKFHTAYELENIHISHSDAKQVTLILKVKGHDRIIQNKYMHSYPTQSGYTIDFFQKNVMDPLREQLDALGILDKREELPTLTILAGIRKYAPTHPIYVQFTPRKWTDNRGRQRIEYTPVFSIEDFIEVSTQEQEPPYKI